MTPDAIDNLATCPKCGSSDCERESCYACLGEGGFDLHDEDAVNYAEGEEIEKCDECGGHGSYWICHGCIALAKAKAGLPI